MSAAVRDPALASWGSPELYDRDDPFPLFAAANQLHALVVTAPDQLRDQLRGLSIDKLVALALTWRPGSTPSSLSATSKLAIRSLARRYRTLSEEIRDLDRSLTALINDVAPQLLAVKGLGAHTSAALLIAVGDNPQRLRSESAFAHLCGAAPIPASSGKTIRYRLNRGGDRQAPSRACCRCDQRWQRHDLRLRHGRLGALLHRGPGATASLSGLFRI